MAGGDGTLPGCTWIVAHPKLHEPEIPPASFGHHLSVDQKIRGLQLEFFQDFPPEEFEGAIDVSQLDA